MSKKPYFTVPEEPWTSGWSAGPTTILDPPDQLTIHVGDKILWSVDGLFEESKYPLRKGTIIKIDNRFVTINFDHEQRRDMRNQKIFIGSSNLKKVE